mmetsp:Transcript_98478/g.279040  ORF Transcript_98478/g.279040 Transcript_98478/m.279040 type:complete len:294 (+) Transcript_98478:125-1006(+)
MDRPRHPSGLGAPSAAGACGDAGRDDRRSRHSCWEAGLGGCAGDATHEGSSHTHHMPSPRAVGTVSACRAVGVEAALIDFPGPALPATARLAITAVAPSGRAQAPPWVSRVGVALPLPTCRRRCAPLGLREGRLEDSDMISSSRRVSGRACLAGAASALVGVRRRLRADSAATSSSGASAVGGWGCPGPSPLASFAGTSCLISTRGPSARGAMVRAGGKSWSVTATLTRRWRCAAGALGGACASVDAQLRDRCFMALERPMVLCLPPQLLLLTSTVADRSNLCGARTRLSQFS